MLDLGPIEEAAKREWRREQPPERKLPFGALCPEHHKAERVLMFGQDDWYCPECREVRRKLAPVYAIPDAHEAKRQMLAVIAELKEARDAIGAARRNFRAWLLWVDAGVIPPSHAEAVKCATLQWMDDPTRAGQAARASGLLGGS